MPECKSLYAQYMKERVDCYIEENEKGFASYKFFDDACYIEDIFVLPEFRKTNVASEIADNITKVAKEKGCNWLLGSVVPSSNGSTTSMKVLLAYGFQLLSAKENFIWFRKRLE